MLEQGLPLVVRMYESSSGWMATKQRQLSFWLQNYWGISAAIHNLWKWQWQKNLWENTEGLQTYPIICLPHMDFYTCLYKYPIDFTLYIVYNIWWYTSLISCWHIPFPGSSDIYIYINKYTDRCTLSIQLPCLWQLVSQPRIAPCQVHWCEQCLPKRRFSRGAPKTPWNKRVLQWLREAPWARFSGFSLLGCWI